MVDKQQTLKSLREIIANTLANLETWDSLPAVCAALDLPLLEMESLGKHKYLSKITQAVDDETILLAAKTILLEYPGLRCQPSEGDKQQIQDSLWWIEGNGNQQISNVTRYRVAEALDGIRFWGRVSLHELFQRANINPIHHSFPDIGEDGCLYEGLTTILMSSLFASMGAAKEKPRKISVREFFEEFGLSTWPDKRFCLLLENIVHPEVHEENAQRLIVERVNKLLEIDGFVLKKEGSQGGLPVFAIREKNPGVHGQPKYIIFASNGPKPDIVFDDAVNMEIRVVRHADKCLIYDQPPPTGDLTWEMLVDWWCKKKSNPINDSASRQELGVRLRSSLQSDPERILFDTYFRVLKPRYGKNLPALLPQVYLHYDPRFRDERSRPVLVRQRMDFLLLLRNNNRVVIEIDGKQHYSDNDDKSSPSRYAEMVAEDRRIKLLGYEVYRFGGAEFTDIDRVKKVIVAFFEDVFARNRILP